MTRRADTTRPDLGTTIATVALSVVAFFAAVASVFVAVLWSESARQTWGVALGMLLPIAMTAIAAVLLTVHFVRLRLARAAEIRRTIDRELQAILKTDPR